ncbi:hypothetical protein H920_10136 [Fukomys damarensis]|uniref:Uncharacterized protein n=1 Tax=Fukomys damarensis TaxID=885580 RepID=A0A091DDF7_FUKDA|nr:hypothetical protein H920_10136 [Fukomys damarensis]
MPGPRFGRNTSVAVDQHHQNGVKSSTPRLPRQSKAARMLWPPLQNLWYFLRIQGSHIPPLQRCFRNWGMSATVWPSGHTAGQALGLTARSTPKLQPPS